MARFCRTPGCDQPTSGYSAHCHHHKQVLRRHGHPLQTGITVHELRPFVARVEARRRKNPDSDAWDLLQARWGLVVDRARETLHQYASGAISIRPARLAAHQIVTVADNVEPWLVTRTALALYLMADQQPRRFASDAAFDYQLVRRVRGLAPANAGTYWDQQAGRARRVYRDIPPRVVVVMAADLKEAFGVGGLRLADIERRDAQRTQDDRERLAEALEGLR